MYFNIGKNAENPTVAKVLAIRQNTPIGASFITVFVISIITSLNWPKKFATKSVLCPNFANITPTNNANTIIGSMSPFAMALIGFLGIIFNKVSAMVGLDAACDTSAT